MDNFRKQIEEDLNFIEKTYLNLDHNLNKKEYAFNFWVLTNLYHVDEELAVNSITEYRDKKIDCYVHFNESKKLFLIQNKYYNENTPLVKDEVDSFLLSPLNVLINGDYKKSIELQRIFDNAKNDSEYTIWLHFYITQISKNSEINSTIDNFNRSFNNPDIKCQIRAKIYYLKDIYELYYIQPFKEKISFKFTLESINQGTTLQIKPKDYHLIEMSEAYYIMTPIIDLFDLYSQAKDKNYSLFDENIREYLGESNINNGIVKTLRSIEERKNFFYYNNGITIICDSIDLNKTPYKLTLHQPQIVNGCQTINTLHEVLSDYEKDKRREEFKNVYIIAKILLKDEESNPEFYKNVVKYTNSQNAINEKAFSSKVDLFLNLQRHFIEKGFLLLVKPSDRNTFKNDYESRSNRNQLLAKANSYLNFNVDGIEIKSINDAMIPLDKLLQVFIAFIKGGYYAYTKKNLVLDANSEIYQNYSLKINDYLTEDSMIKLFLLYKKAETDKKNSEDKKSPVPYYLVGFLGNFIKDKDHGNLNKTIKELYSSKDIFSAIYDYFKQMTNLYKKKYGKDYNIMIKQQIDLTLLNDQINTLDTIYEENQILKNFINKLG